MPAGKTPIKTAFAAVLLLASLFTSMLPATELPNPMNYQGKSVSEWAGDLRSDNQETRKKATDALVAIGEPSVFYLRALLREVENPKVRGRAITTTRLLGVKAKAALPELIQCLRAEEYFIRGWGSRAIGAIGSEANVAVPALVESFKTWDHDSKSHGYSALAAIGPAAAPALIKLMDEGDLESKRRAASALGRIQPSVEAAVRRLERATQDGEPLLQGEAAFAHWKMTKSGELANHVLSEALNSRDRAVRHQAGLSFLQMGQDARGASEALTRTASSDPDRTIREYAVRTLRMIAESEK